MRISFCYIEGISAVDTPYFDTIEDQAFFFERHEVGYIDTTFYPPHYNNSIRVDVNDFNFNSEVNYVRFQYLNKWYYYFIESIEYLNEFVIVVKITMDVIQTYYGNIKIDSGIIERRFVNRCVGNTININRKYIRENVSNGIFTLKTKTIIDGADVTKYTIINKTTTVQKASAGSYAPVAATACWLYDINASEFISNKNYNYVGDTKITFVSALHYQNDTGDLLYGNITVLGGLAESLDLFVCPFVPLKGISISSNIAVCDNTYSKYRYNFDDMHGETINYLHTDLCRIAVYSTYINLSLYFGTVNHSINNPYDYKRIYQMLDENYILVEFGSLTASTVYPLYYLDMWALYGRYWFNMSDGTRCYLLNDTNSSVLEDKYSTIVVDTNILYLDMFNSRWNDYIANNKNRWAQITMGATVSALGTIAGISSRTASYSTLDITESKSLGVKGTVVKGITGFDARGSVRERSTSRDVDSTQTYYSPSKGAQGVTDIFNELWNENNIVNSPYNKKQSMTFGTSIVDTNALIFSRISIVNDYEQCAQYYHRNGYYVNDYVNGLDEYEIFDMVNNRYYFNILKMKNMDISLADVINDENTIELIKERLSNGIRLWNIAPLSSILNDRFDIGTFEYDNVELDYLQ